MLRQDVASSAMELPVLPAGLGLVGGVKAYVALTKPRIISLLLVTTLPAMIVANGGLPSLWLVLVTLVGGALAAAGANTINCYLDRDIDELMARTRTRPIPAGDVEPEQALIFGVTLGIVSFALLVTWANDLAALLAMAALGFYVLVYTVWLKRSSSQNIVIGGAAGAIPPLVGWAAVTGGLGWPAFLLFLIIFLWTPPHFWALALRYRGDYERAGVPMLPVVAGEAETNRQIALYSVVLVAASLVFAAVAGTGWLYVASAVVLGAGFLWLALRQWLTPSPRSARALFLYSLAYLGLLFVAMGVDGLLF